MCPSCDLLLDLKSSIKKKKLIAFNEQGLEKYLNKDINQRGLFKQINSNASKTSPHISKK